MHHQDTPIDPEILASLRQVQDQVAEKIKSALLEQEAKKLGLGGTGRYPSGKLTADDEGEIVFTVGELNGKVVINYGTQVMSVGMTPGQAHELAKMLHKYAREIQGRQ